MLALSFQFCEIKLFKTHFNFGDPAEN